MQCQVVHLWMGGLSEFQFAFITPLIIDIKSSNVLWNISAFSRFKHNS